MKTESEIQKEIIEFLKSKGIFHWRSQVYKGTVKSGKYLHTGVIGLADITCMLKDKHLYIEVKDYKGEQKTAQKAFQSMCNCLGHDYIVARSVEDVEQYFSEVILRAKPHCGNCKEHK